MWVNVSNNQNIYYTICWGIDKRSNQRSNLLIFCNLGFVILTQIEKIGKKSAHSFSRKLRKNKKVTVLKHDRSLLELQLESVHWIEKAEE